MKTNFPPALLLAGHHSKVTSVDASGQYDAYLDSELPLFIILIEDAGLDEVSIGGDDSAGIFLSASGRLKLSMVEQWTTFFAILFQILKSVFTRSSKMQKAGGNPFQKKGGATL